MKNKIICIVGPTASGKTGLSIELAKKINAEIISADSMQIYKNLNIGTAKVTKKEAEGIPHHLINICEIDQKFSVAEFKNMCYDKIDEILQRGKNVIIVGGTGLYINSIVYNMNFDEQEIDFEYRRYLEDLAKNTSKEEVFKILQEIDPKSAENIHPNNLKRVIRAIEIAKNSNVLKSEHMKNELKRIEVEESKYDFLIFNLIWDRETLNERINKRVDMMMEQGLLDEAKKVYDMNLAKDNTCMQAIAYKEFFSYFEGKNSLEEAIEKLKLESRKYAKRQVTWFKNKLKTICLNGNESKEKLTQDIIKYINVD